MKKRKEEKVAPPAKVDLVIWGGTALTLNPQEEIISNALIKISQGKILSIESQKKPEAPKGVKTLDARGCLVMPGLINGHTHTGMSMLRGVADDYPLSDWLHHHIFPLERQWGNEKFVYTGTQLACLEMIRSGTTTFNDMYYFEEMAAKAVHEMGMRAICGQTYISISGVEKSSEVLPKFDKYFATIKKFPRITGAIAPHSIYGLPDDLWKEIVRYADDHELLVHTHLAEMQDEVDETLKKRGVTPTEWFESIGLWEQKAIVAHAVCLAEKDIRILAKYGVGVSHCPESNLKLGSKICPVSDLRAAGVSVALGTDSTASNNNLDILQESDTAAKLQVLRYGVGKVPAKAIVKMLTIEGAKALHLADQIGSLEPGKQADLIAVNVEAPHCQPLYDPYSHLVYSASGADVRHTVVAGQVLMKDREILIASEKKILEEVKKWGKKISSSDAKLKKT